MKIRRIWPTSRHPRPAQLHPGHTISIRQDRQVTVTGLGRRHDRVLAAGIDDDGNAVLLAWDDTAGCWVIEPWQSVTSEADR